jgi:hypothetical protein
MRCGQGTLQYRRLSGRLTIPYHPFIAGLLAHRQALDYSRWRQ